MRRITLGALGVALAIALWELSARAGWVDPRLLTPPSGFLGPWWGTMRSGELPEHMLATAIRIGLGFSLAVAFGMVMGIACHLVRPFREFTAAIVEIIRAIPPLALLPAFLLLFGIGLKYPVAVIVWVAWIPVFLSTLDGLDGVDKNIREAAWEFCSMPRVVLHVVLPVAAPQILVGMRIAMGTSFLTIVVAEMMGPTSGMGYFILDASATFRIPEMYGAILTLGAMAFSVNWVLMRVMFTAFPHLRETEPRWRLSYLGGLYRRRGHAPESAPGTFPRSQPSRPLP